MKETRTKLIILMLLVLGLIAVMALTSCAPKYGCGHGHPRQSWDKLIKRIN
jgi:hypothetical protein